LESLEKPENLEELAEPELACLIPRGLRAKSENLRRRFAGARGWRECSVDGERNP
jgi:hypothetical protein